MSDKELIVACMRDEMWAKKALYEQYAPAMLSLCTRYVGERETARDVLQDAFVKVFTKIDTFAESGSFESWMRRIFVTTALEYLRKKRELRLDKTHENTIEDNDFGIFDKLATDDLHCMISELPEGCRTVFNLYAVEDYSHKEIAEILHIEEATSRSQYFYARELLKKKIGKLMF
jgi:RNA polymerase sigma-70 factor (ECF subfamily)